MNRTRVRSMPLRFLAPVAALPLAALLAAGTTMGGCSKKRKAVRTDSVYEQLAEKLEQSARAPDAKEVRQACTGAARRSCSCVRTAARLALNRDLHTVALLVLAKPPVGCLVRGLLAEALARAKRLEEAEREARTALGTNPQDRYATYAVAHVHYLRGQTRRARAAAQQAVQRGRGSVAHLLIGLLDFRAKQLQEALKSFEQMRKLDPRDADAIYNIALVHHQLSHYRLAREGYLAALRINPRYSDARYNLVVLAHGVGAVAEARHHLKKYSALRPADARLRRLRALLNQPRRRSPRVRRGNAPLPTMTSPPSPPAATMGGAARPRRGPHHQARPVGPTRSP
jgi:tetratricopeptide (TPR) repeat protein